MRYCGFFKIILYPIGNLHRSGTGRTARTKSHAYKIRIQVPHLPDRVKNDTNIRICFWRKNLKRKNKLLFGQNVLNFHLFLPAVIFFNYDIKNSFLQEKYEELCCAGFFSWVLTFQAIKHKRKS